MVSTMLATLKLERKMKVMLYTKDVNHRSADLTEIGKIDHIKTLVL